ncbi:MAG: hypothetical protein IJC59_07500 [Lachnospiraceae bacterium]|nr:hypothetical protein [Lachnospiraceae bacterium]
MGELFVDLVKSVCIFLITGQSILHFGIGRGYEKYVRAVISFMVAAQLISGFFVMTGKKGGFEMEDLIRGFEQDLEDMEQYLQSMEETLRERVDEAQKEFAPGEADGMEEAGEAGIQIPQVEVILQ